MNDAKKKQKTNNNEIKAAATNIVDESPMLNAIPFI